MKPLSWIKQPWESRILEIDCSDTLPSAVTISSVAIAIFNAAGADQSVTMIEGVASIVSSKVYVQVKGGTDAANYNCRVRLTLSNGELAEDDIKIYVRETV
jgi:hypothetical protein